MLEACKEQLNWGVERYAKLPNPPELLPVKNPHFPRELLGGMAHLEEDGPFEWGCCFIILSPILVPILVVFTPFWFPYLLIIRWENGRAPSENARRKRGYEAACTTARKAAEPVKAAQDHRLTVQIRELDGLIKTVTEKAEDVRGILRTLC